MNLTRKTHRTEEPSSSEPGKGGQESVWAPEGSLGLQAWGAVESYGKVYKVTPVEEVATEGGVSREDRMKFT